MPLASVRACCALMFLLLFGVGTLAKAQESLTIMPLPSHAVRHSGSLSLDQGLGVTFEGYTEPRLEQARGRFLATLAREMGVLPVPERQAPEATLVIRTARASAAIQQLDEDESYKLEIRSTGAVLSAPNPLGVLHGLQTFLQLVTSTPSGFRVAAMTIEDRPRFPWRGLLIDTGRHFMPLDVIRQNLDGMEALKLNVFHWHLSDDQGFRVESRTYPLLQEKGSDGLYYTQTQVREIVAYARDRGIRVIPEFDMPGHATSWFVGYPELASGKGPYRIERRWGIFDPAMDPTRESTYQFLNAFLAEMTALFPDAYFHIGGDECNGKEWSANPHIQQYMRAHHIADNAALQAYFTGRVEELVRTYHKTAVGWDEVLQPNTPHDVVIQSWRGSAALGQAARQGYRGLLSAGYYLDLNWSAAEHYVADPLEAGTAALSAEEARQVLGGEATMWTEYMSPENINHRIWPRAAAVAERLWSPAGTVDVASMYNRLTRMSEVLTYHGLDYQTSAMEMMQRLRSGDDAGSLQVLASVVHPPRNYVREKLRNYDTYTPLNRLADTVPAESDAARIFNDTAARIVAGKASPGDWATARQTLTLWKDNDAQLHPWLLRSALTTDLVPVSHGLSRSSEIGLNALDHLQKGMTMPTAEQDEQLSELTQIEKPEAVLVNMTISGVELLLQAVKTQ